jgi:hypothetical protein
MAVGLRLKFDGGTQEQYDAVHSQVLNSSWPPQGLIFHSAGPIEGGWGVIDFWESRAEFDTFIANTLQPALQQVGPDAFQGPPDIKEFPVHNHEKP